MVALCAVAALLLSGPCRAQTASPGGGAPTSAQPESPKPPAAITGLTDTAPVADPNKKHGPGLTLGLSDDLVVLLDGDAPLVPSDWVLYLDGKALPDLAATAYDSGHGLVYRLQRTADDRAVWTSILGAPTDTTRPVKVSVARMVDGNESPHLLPPASNASVVFRMNILWTWWVWFAAVLALGTLFAMGVAIVKTPVLRDDVLPQLPWELREFSLGRCQMAFWFALVLVSFLFLWALLWDYNTLTTQALTLMGISAATGLGALAANTTNDDDLEHAKKALADAKVNSPEDFEVVLNDLAELKAKKKKALVQENKPNDPDLDEIASLEARIAPARKYISLTYQRGDKARYRYIFNDLINDDNGPALHRLQLVGWTVAVGVVFVVAVYRDLSMPEFSATLLALMGVSGASYVGFKFPEKT